MSWETEEAVGQVLAGWHAQSGDQVELEAGRETVVAQRHIVEEVVVVGGGSRIQTRCKGSQLALAEADASSINVGNQAGIDRGCHAGAADSVVSASPVRVADVHGNGGGGIGDRRDVRRGAIRRADTRAHVPLPTRNREIVAAAAAAARPPLFHIASQIGVEVERGAAHASCVNGGTWVSSN